MLVRNADEDVKRLEVRQYGASEIYRMLMDSFGDDLDAKLDPQMLVGLVGENIPISQTLANLEDRILALLDDFDEAPYRLV